MLQNLLANYYEIAHDYDVADYRSDVGDHPPQAAVTCEFGAADGVAEARRVQRLADSSGWPSAFIAAADLTSPTLGDTLSAYAELPVVRAVRQPLYWDQDPLRRLGSRPGLLTDPTWLTGFERVVDHGPVWNLLVCDEQLPAAELLLRSFPEAWIVLEATGWPLDLSDEGFLRWRERLEVIAAHPNVRLKMQGLALIFGPTRHQAEPWVRSTLEIFGADRCMFASHFPVDRLLWSGSALVQVLQAVTSNLSEAERRDFFAGCASPRTDSTSEVGSGPERGRRHPGCLRRHVTQRASVRYPLHHVGQHPQPVRPGDRASAVHGEIEWGEFYWHGHHTDGSTFAMRGVTILVVHDGLIIAGRLYMEPVEVGGDDIGIAVQELYKPPAVPSP